MTNNIKFHSEVNPFKDNGILNEIKFYGLKKYDKNGIMIKEAAAVGPLDDYLNVNFRIGKIKFPRMFIDEELWMSLSHMEIQSHWVPIRKAQGHVAAAGLGMGYFTLRVMQKDGVESVDVYEKEQRVVDYFKENFSDRPGFEKVNFIIGDAREKMKGQQYDFVFVDIYQTLLPDELITDAELFQKNNEIYEYYPWGYCLVMLHILERGITKPHDFDINELLKMWMDDEASDLKRVCHWIEDEYLKNVLDMVRS